MRIAFTTLGCKINQHDTDILRREMESQGNVIVPFGEVADIYIINTCSVTAKSDSQCRQLIRTAVRRGGTARVVVTGCYAETRSDEVSSIQGVDRVFGSEGKPDIPNYIATLREKIENEPIDQKAKVRVQKRTRGVIQIQNGCNNHCSYCIVPLARGKSRSIPLAKILREFEQLVKSGCPEIVLSGIHVGMYGMDIDKNVNLGVLLGHLIGIRGISRIRLSSIEPREVSDEIIRYLGKGLCRHLHIPLQSGDDSILAAMQRNYTASFYRDSLERIAREVPGIALGADVIVGFPGEGDEEFQNTMNLVESSPLTHLHVFSYSPRPGTPAAAMKKQVPESVKKERSEALRRLGDLKNLMFRKKHIASVLDVVVEDKFDRNTGMLSGLTDNYIRVKVAGAIKENIGKEIRVRLNSVENNENIATALQRIEL